MHCLFSYPKTLRSFGKTVFKRDLEHIPPWRLRRRRDEERLVNVYKTSGDADREAEDGDDDDDDVLENEEGLAEAAVVVPEGE